jgi:hypothetical protein
MLVYNNGVHNHEICRSAQQSVTLKKQRTAQSSTEDVFVQMLNKERVSYLHLDRLIVNLETSSLSTGIPGHPPPPTLHTQHCLHSDKMDLQRQQLTSMFLEELEKSKVESSMLMTLLQEAKNKLPK